MSFSRFIFNFFLMSLFLLFFTVRNWEPQQNQMLKDQRTVFNENKIKTLLILANRVGLVIEGQAF